MRPVLQAVFPLAREGLEVRDSNCAISHTHTHIWDNFSDERTEYENTGQAKAKNVSDGSPSWAYGHFSAHGGKKRRLYMIILDAFYVLGWLMNRGDTHKRRVDRSDRYTVQD